jgi:signal transduction histidine kinase
MKKSRLYIKGIKTNAYKDTQMNKMSQKISEIVDALTRIESGDLSVKLPEGDEPGELSPVVAKLNSLVRTLEDKLQGSNNDGSGREANTELEPKLALMRSIQRSKRAALAEIVSVAAHEINNPLAIIFGRINMMGHQACEKEKQEASLATIEAAALRITKTVAVLRRFSSSGAKRDFKQVSLGNLIKNAVSMTWISSNFNQVTLDVIVSSDSPVLCDEVEIEQVLINLINNGVHAVKDLHERWVRVTVDEDDTCVVLRVADSGRGIPESVSGRIFEPFFSTKKADEGAGLGLSISKDILDAHGATIALLSKAENTTFEIRFKKHFF